jgi:hypothetical protein
VTTNLDLTSYLGLSNLRLRFNYSGSAGSNWAVDNLGIPGPQPPLTYAWKLIDPPGVTYPYYLNDTTKATVKAGPPAPGTYTYQVTTTYGGCPGGSQNVVVVVNPLPTVSVNSATICQGSSATIVATPGTPATYSYSWTVPAGAINPGNVSSFTTSTPGLTLS